MPSNDTENKSRAQAVFFRVKLNHGFFLELTEIGLNLIIFYFQIYLMIQIKIYAFFIQIDSKLSSGDITATNKQNKNWLKNEGMKRSLKTVMLHL